MIHRKKNRPALQRRDILTVFLVFFFFFFFFFFGGGGGVGCSLAFLSLGVPFLAISRAVLIYLVLFSGLF